MGCINSTHAGVCDEITLPDAVVKETTLFKTMADIPEEYFAEKRVIVGYVVNVPDGDGLRARHIPNGKFGPVADAIGVNDRRKWPEWRHNLKKETLLIRFYGVDAPETEKPGNPGQPFANESTDFVKDKLMDQNVYIKLLGKDPFGRGLARIKYSVDGSFSCVDVILGRKSTKEGDVCEDLLRQGLACVYRFLKLNRSHSPPHAQ
eukprot:GHVT01045094.1.p1 GENE.GHVT01045094.1~~GHVT01045094.1.p1  ORF type:complete len:205 (-),score=20.82 GHVT01045094.1:863-1477(-)